MARLQTLTLLTLIAIAATPLAIAAETLELYPTPKTETARSVQTLFNATFIIAMIVFVGVEGLLFYIIWKFRNNKTVPANETHRGNTRAEIIWTIIPAVVLLGLGGASAMTLFTIDEIPENPDFAVRVEASQFVWQFIYPTGAPTFNDLRVETGQLVRLDVVSKDVEHQLFIPAFAIKLSAIPGRTNHQWFLAPEPGHYPLECTMYCGYGHHDMGAASTTTGVNVFAKGAQPLPYGPAPRAPPSS